MNRILKEIDEAAAIDACCIEPARFKLLRGTQGGML
jgi:hypothetical protein